MASVVVHAHCYQPPREDPWLEVVESERSAAPDHDWNARIDRECYSRLAAVEIPALDTRAAARDPDARAGIARIVNLYGWCTFDVGATLCEWLDGSSPATLAAMVAGDRASVQRLGHGNAIAAPYHHVILPLASARDRTTEIRWGVADFRRRFGRDPEGMWLPECAADEDTLDALAAEGIRFTILAAYQLRGNADHRGLPVRWRGSRGRELLILPYEPSLAGEVAFGGLLDDADGLARRLAGAADDDLPRCTTLATDGETFGHHHRNGDLTLATALTRLVSGAFGRVALTNAAALVANTPPTQDVELISPSSWSCAHGVERWRNNCGCRLDGGRPPAQEWRAPLRAALTSLAQELDVRYEREGALVFHDDPWVVRDAYGSVVALDGVPLREFARTSVAPGDDGDVRRGQELLEMQRATLRMFTSCAWFFDDVERIETRQVLRYAARAIELAQARSSNAPPDSHAPFDAFVEALAAARSPSRPGDAKELFLREGVPAHDAVWRVAAAAAALTEAAGPTDAPTRVGVFDVRVAPNPGSSIRDWTVEITHRRTGAQSSVFVTLSGHGAALEARVRASRERDVAEQTVSVREFPESIARTLLRGAALDGDALGVPE